MKIIYSSLVLLTCFTFSVWGQGKIAIVDLRKVFDDYYKTKAADAQLKDQAADLAKESKAYMEQYQKASDDYKKFLDEANNQAVSGDEREKRKKAAEGKLVEIKELETTIRQFDNTARTTLEEKKRQMREKILGAIRDIINAKAKAAGYAMVIDVAAESVNQTPVVMYNNGDNDITQAVLQELNASAPIIPKSEQDTRKKEPPDPKKNPLLGK
ncbi:MAG TPA: OmpH family outer membrane protein [Verrucomicrobiae bacterium]|nr:OmpH family outer membrane protein [Verrucomicrobiae bacterium]